VPRTEDDNLQAAFEPLDKERWAEAIAKLEVLQTSADPEVRDKALNFLADALVRRQGRIEEAEEIYARALDILRDDQPEIRVMTLRNIAYLYWTTGGIDRAREKPYVEPPVPDDVNRN
jgi:tetratricopeptide (TPR) repeat protein